MADPNDVTTRPPSLIRRRRSFVATPPEQAEPLLVPSTTATASSELTEEDDLPVLTEVISAEAAVSESNLPHFDETQVSVLASDIAHAIGQQLTYELPTLIEAVLLTAGEELRAGITSTMETALRDFIARRKQLRLPLEEPDDEPQEI